LFRFKLRQIYPATDLPMDDAVKKIKNPSFGQNWIPGLLTADTQ
jgi:hypothetical protein